jgi:hypothetical protein
MKEEIDYSKMSNDEINALRYAESAEYGKKQIKKFFNKLAKSKKVSELKMTGEYSLTFKFIDDYNTIAWHLDSECMVINPGLGDPFTNDSHEIGFYEIGENYF